MHLYLHIPFCHRECPYCAFYKHTPGATRIRAFIDSLLVEASLRISPRSAPKTIFMGGGTPSMLSIAHFQRLAAGLAEQLDFSQLEEWSLEANPATFDLAKARAWKAAGVTRVSLGVQSFSPRFLKLLGREHSAESAQKSVAILREAGIEHINIDLMFSLPGQDIADWEANLNCAVALDVDHISTYNLSYEEDTAFFQRYGAEAGDEEQDIAFFTRAEEILCSAGFRHYEISNYAREGERSLHNLACWRGQDYIGLGPSACSTQQGIRYENAPDTEAYIHALQSGQLPPHDASPLSPEEQREEHIALALRSDEGLATEWQDERMQARLAPLLEEGLIVLGPQQNICLTTKGRLLCDEVTVELM